MKNICLVLLIALRLGAEVLVAQDDHNLPARLTLQVSSPDGLPVEEATGGATFIKFNYQTMREEYLIRREATGKAGSVTFEGETIDDEVSYGAEKKGYYPNVGLKYRFKERVNGRWLPWNPTVDVVLKRIVAPIPLMAKRVAVGIPIFDKAVGFDFETGDWVVPYGVGRMSDIIFTAHLVQRSAEDFDYELRVSFPNEWDGIQNVEGPPIGRGSLLRSSYEAPESGYKREWKQFRTQTPNASERNNVNRDRIYYLRLRTVSDKDGKITRANYGKIYGDFLDFTYYFNPKSNDRNLEFDTTRNLLQGSPADVEISVP